MKISAVGGRAGEGLKEGRRDERGAARERKRRYRSHRCRGSRMNIAGPSQNRVRGIYRRRGSAERVVDCCAFLFERWGCKEGELRGRIGLKGDIGHCTGRSRGTERQLSPWN